MLVSRLKMHRKLFLDPFLAYLEKSQNKVSHYLSDVYLFTKGSDRGTLSLSGEGIELKYS